MFFQLVCKLVITGCGFLYPVYASYKAIKSNDLQRLEVWLMYWVVMGCVMALEGTVEWFFKWIPFYYEFKTLVLLWLTLPQIQGSTYLYITHIHPFLINHEKDIDAAIEDAKVKAKQVGLDWFNRLLVRAREMLLGGGNAAAAQSVPPRDSQSSPSSSGAEPPPSSPSSQFYALAEGVLKTYGPAAVAATSALLHPMAGREASVNPPAGGRSRNASDTSALLKKKSSGNLAGLGTSTTAMSSGVNFRPRERTVSGYSTSGQRTSRKFESDDRDLPPPPFLSHPSSTTSSSSSGHPINAPSQRQFQRPSSANFSSRSANSSTANLNSCNDFEEIGKDDLAGGEWENSAESTRLLPRDNETTEQGGEKKSWWWWSTKGAQGQPGLKES